MTENLVPLPDDPDYAEVRELLNMTGEDYVFLSQPGERHTFLAETWQMDGANHQTVLVGVLPVRENHGKETFNLTICLHPEDAAGLVMDMIKTIRFYGVLQEKGLVS